MSATTENTFHFPVIEGNDVQTDYRALLIGVFKLHAGQNIVKLEEHRNFGASYAFVPTGSGSLVLAIIATGNHAWEKLVLFPKMPNDTAHTHGHSGEVLPLWELNREGLQFNHFRYGHSNSYRGNEALVEMMQFTERLYGDFSKKLKAIYRKYPSQTFIGAFHPTKK